MCVDVASVHFPTTPTTQPTAFQSPFLSPQFLLCTAQTTTVTRLKGCLIYGMYGTAAQVPTRPPSHPLHHSLNLWTTSGGGLQQRGIRGNASAMGSQGATRRACQGCAAHTFRTAVLSTNALCLWGQDYLDVHVCASATRSVYLDVVPDADSIANDGMLIQPPRDPDTTEIATRHRTEIVSVTSGGVFAALGGPLASLHCWAKSQPVAL